MIRWDVVFAYQPHPNPPQSWGGRFASNARSPGPKAHSNEPKNERENEPENTRENKPESKRENKPENEREKKRARMRTSSPPRLGEIQRGLICRLDFLPSHQRIRLFRLKEKRCEVWLPPE